MIYLLFNQKGGVSKSGLATEIAGNLAIKGKKVLLMDFDSQGNVAQTFGINPFDKVERDTYALMFKYFENPEEAIKTFEDWKIREKKHHENLDVAYGTMSLSSVEVDFYNLMKEIGPMKALNLIKQMFKDLEKSGGYDYIIIDTSPTLGIFQAALINSVDKIIIPSVMEKFSQLGIIGIIDSMKKMANMMDIESSELIDKIEMVVPTKIENVKDHKIVHAQLFETLPKYSKIKVLKWEEGIPKATEFSRVIREKEITPVLADSKNKATVAITSLVEKHILNK